MVAFTQCARRELLLFYDSGHLPSWQGYLFLNISAL